MKNTESGKETAVFDKVNINMDKLSEFEIQQGKNLLHRYFNILSRTTQTWDFHPSNSHNARYHQKRKSHLQQMFDAGIIRRSHPPFNLHQTQYLSDKKQFKNLHRLSNNNIVDPFLILRTISNAYSLSQVVEILDIQIQVFQCTTHEKWIPSDGDIEKQRERTAFTVGPLGFFEYNRMPFGFSIAPGAYQRLMEQCLDEEI